MSLAGGGQREQRKEQKALLQQVSKPVLYFFLCISMCVFFGCICVFCSFVFVFYTLVVNPIFQGGVEVWQDPLPNLNHTDGLVHVLPVCRTIAGAQSHPRLHQGALRTSLDWDLPRLLPLPRAADEEPHLQHDAVHWDPHGHPVARCR